MSRRKRVVKVNPDLFHYMFSRFGKDILSPAETPRPVKAMNCRAARRLNIYHDYHASFKIEVKEV